MTKQNIDYGYDIQKTYLEIMLSDAQTFVRCQGIFDPTLFDRRLQTTAQFLTDFVAEHNTLPTQDIINSSCDVKLEPSKDLNEQHYDWLLNDFETFCRHKSLEKAILESADLLEKGEYGPVEETYYTRTKIYPCSKTSITTLVSCRPVVTIFLSDLIFFMKFITCLLPGNFLIVVA